MGVVGLDHLVVNTKDVDRAIEFYRDVLGMEILRLDQFRKGEIGFVSARVSPETIIDIRPDPSGEKVTPNVDHYCLVLGPTDMKKPLIRWPYCKPSVAEFTGKLPLAG